MYDMYVQKYLVPIHTYCLVHLYAIWALKCHFYVLYFEPIGHGASSIQEQAIIGASTAT